MQLYDPTFNYKNWAFKLIHVLKLDPQTYIIVEIVTIVQVWGGILSFGGLISTNMVSLRAKFNTSRLLRAQFLRLKAS